MTGCPTRAVELMTELTGFLWVCGRVLKYFESTKGPFCSRIIEVVKEWTVVYIMMGLGHCYLMMSGESTTSVCIKNKLYPICAVEVTILALFVLFLVYWSSRSGLFCKIFWIHFLQDNALLAKDFALNKPYIMPDLIILFSLFRSHH